MLYCHLNISPERHVLNSPEEQGGSHLRRVVSGHDRGEDRIGQEINDLRSFYLRRPVAGGEASAGEGGERRSVSRGREYKCDDWSG
ncbi:hypothetical protein EUGRSUZ_F00714 [Eucalyptus grandis]|uniref:Uncharacterized protein n=2 Tax=Eucalyptus grandis TaxID=71139 RepID=A0ACC3KCG9_EUCGR|nr:hypothetical protein EUGRSUZ_F00714 [Eucalyptus grandis]